jgi:hypothetical protein
MTEGPGEATFRDKLLRGQFSAWLAVTIGVSVTVTFISLLVRSLS